MPSDDPARDVSSSDIPPAANGEVVPSAGTELEAPGNPGGPPKSAYKEMLVEELGTAVRESTRTVARRTAVAGGSVQLIALLMIVVAFWQPDLDLNPSEFIAVIIVGGALMMAAPLTGQAAIPDPPNPEELADIAERSVGARERVELARRQRNAQS